jgi:hypothetical protein
MRRQGRIVWESYFGTTKSIIDTVLANLRIRINIPAFPIKEEPSQSVFNTSFILKTEDIIPDDPMLPESDDDYLGPVEPAFQNQRFERNFSRPGQGVGMSPAEWFHLFPSNPFDPVMPSEAKFLGKYVG